jgi:hypothetical protein
MSYIKYKIYSWQQSAGERCCISKLVSAPQLDLQLCYLLSDRVPSKSFKREVLRYRSERICE